MIISVWFTKMKFSLKNAKINVLWPPNVVFTKRKNTYSFKWCSSKVTPANLRKKQHKTQILVKKTLDMPNKMKNMTTLSEILERAARGKLLWCRNAGLPERHWGEMNNALWLATFKPHTSEYTGISPFRYFNLYSCFVFSPWY